MTRDEACAILGVSPSASHSEARKKYLDLIKIFHVDRLPEKDRASANDQMARINLAWEVFQQPHSASKPSAKPRADDGFHYSARAANSEECRLCGGTPAQFADFRAVNGFFLRIRFSDQKGPLCKGCATAIFEFSQVQCWTAWWGISIFPAILALIKNRQQIAKYREFRPASFRDPSVQTPFYRPLAGIDPDSLSGLRWVSPALAACAWILALVFLLSPIPVGGSGSTTASPTPATTSLKPFVPSGPPSSPPRLKTARDYIGVCWQKIIGSKMIRPVDCTSSTARWLSYKVVSDRSQCEETYIPFKTPSDKKRSACLRKI